MLKLATTLDKPNSQSEETSLSTEMTKTKMIAPGSKDAPKFKSSEPEGLRRFIGRMEDLWKDAGIEESESKKKMIGKYADIDCEEEWSAFETYEKGSWDEFKEELIANYPEAAAAERGTPARIRKICSQAKEIMLGDMAALYSFRRAFMSEAKKLLKEPAIMGNRELVEMFISCLSERLASAVLQFLGNKTPNTKSGIATRRPEDKYDLEEVCNAALQVSENSQGMYSLMEKSHSRGVLLLSQPISETKVLSEKLTELEGEQALGKDRLDSLDKDMKARFNSLEELIKSKGACKGDCKNSNCKTHEASSSSGQKWGGNKAQENERCFWCGQLGHFQADCEDLERELSLGNVKMNHENKLRLRDGSFIPKSNTESTLKERVKRHYAKKPSQFYYDAYEENDPVPFVATNTWSQANDSDKRTILQLRAELDLRKREEALALKQKMLEQNEKRAEQSHLNTRAVNKKELLEQLTDEDWAAIQAAKSGFI